MRKMYWLCRNYHVFYYLLLGVNEEERKEFHLKQPEDYFYLNQVICDLPMHWSGLSVRCVKDERKENKLYWAFCDVWVSLFALFWISLCSITWKLKTGKISDMNSRDWNKPWRWLASFQQQRNSKWNSVSFCYCQLLFMGCNEQLGSRVVLWGTRRAECLRAHRLILEAELGLLTCYNELP